MIRGEEHPEYFIAQTWRFEVHGIKHLLQNLSAAE